jgi:hypothetical protein
MHCDRQEWHLLKAALERVDVIMPSVTGNGTDIALVRECEGILYSEKKMWNLAFAKFHESFTKFCESNHDRRAELLMYVLLLLWWCCCCGGAVVVMVMVVVMVVVVMMMMMILITMIIIILIIMTSMMMIMYN